MYDYQAPLRDYRFLLEEVFGADRLWDELANLYGVTPELAQTVLEQAARIASGELRPLNMRGDQQGCEWDDGAVRTPDGFPAAFQALGEGGWLGIAGNPDFGGQGLPKMLTVLVEEMFYSANTSLFLYATLTAGAAYCIDSHGSAAMKRLYLPKLYDGSWAGAMVLTEPHAGTDLGLLRTKAVQGRDGHYQITGTKIYISGGEHDLAENIIHLVLARLPDSPPGSKGLSLFLVPKFLPDSDGKLGARNAMHSQSLEHKMGIRGSATSVMAYEGATGFLVGKPNQGLAAMFTMMNYERLSVGIQGLGLSAGAYQGAAHYAAERRQGRSPEGAVAPDEAADPILVHPDVRRMLLYQRAHNDGGRAFAMLVGRELDKVRYSDDAAEREQAARFVGLLTPVAKAFLTDRGFDCCVLAQQVYGGAGYIVETGVEQYVRDARIAQIYEGANGIQAMDLIGRKVLRDQGATLYEFLDVLAAEAERDLADSNHRGELSDALQLLREVATKVIKESDKDARLAGAIANDFLQLLALTTYASLWARMAVFAPKDPWGNAKRETAAFFFARILPQTRALAAGIEQGLAGMDYPDNYF